MPKISLRCERWQRYSVELKRARCSLGVMPKFFTNLLMRVDSLPSPQYWAMVLSGLFELVSISRAASSRSSSTILLGVFCIDSEYLRMKVLSLIFMKFASTGTVKSVLRFSLIHACKSEN